MSVFGQGQGLNSIRWRFATAGAVLSALTVTGSQIVLGVRVAGEPRAWAVALGAAVLVGAAFLWMASRLTALVEALLKHTAGWRARTRPPDDGPRDPDRRVKQGLGRLR